MALRTSTKAITDDDCDVSRTMFALACSSRAETPATRQSSPENYLLAGGVVLSDDMPADAGADDGLAMPEAPIDEPDELAPEGAMVSVLVDGAGELIGAGAAVSAFLPQAPSASKVDKAAAVASADFEAMEYMRISLLKQK